MKYIESKKFICHDCKKIFLYKDEKFDYAGDCILCEECWNDYIGEDLEYIIPTTGPFLLLKKWKTIGTQGAKIDIYIKK